MPSVNLAVPTDRIERWLRAAALWVIVAGALICAAPILIRAPVEKTLREASVTLSYGKHAEARRLATEVLRSVPNSTQALLIAGEASAKLMEPDASIAFFDQVSDRDPAARVQARFGKAERLLWQGRVSQAESLFRKVMEENPQHIGANRSLSFLYQVLGRTFEAVPHAHRLIIQDRFRGDQIRMAGATELFFVKDDLYLRLCLLRVPNDPLPFLPAARLSLLQHKLEPAEGYLKRVLAVHPNVSEAQGRLGRLLLNQGRFDELLEWQRHLPIEADQHPEVWFVRGGLLQQLKRPREAARCYLEALWRFPQHVEATWQVSQMLARLGHTEAANEAGRRAGILAKIELTLSELHDGPSEEKMHEATDLFVSVNRLWEASAMCQMAIRVLPLAPQWATRGLKEYSRRIATDPSFDDIPELPFASVTREQFPLPEFQSIAPAQRTSAHEAEVAPCRVQFSEDAAAAGLNFTYFNGSVTPKGLEHIFETTGGGVAAIDFDGDLWPDLCFTQGTELWSSDANGRHLDRLFRNLGDGQFADVTDSSGIHDEVFGQGAAVGDFNNDGFPDLYIGNLGRNKLLVNNGDGTFCDVTESTGVGGDEWTLSSLIADVNGDSLPDVYATNYLDPQAVTNRRCKKNGQPLTCAPTQFPAQDDRLYLNLGDGRFRDVTQDCGIVRPDGKGLALVAFRFPEDRCLSLFIGNDTTNNFLFRNQTTRPGTSPTFREDGVLSGLAADAAGRAQATMGIAADDADGDGQLDFFVTAFIREANTLYLQQSGATFLDASRSAQLHGPSLDLLGFGTQFIDGELDGFPDLIVTNGHVDRSWATGEPDEMRPQYFRNRGDGRFDEIPGTQLGDFFVQQREGARVQLLLKELRHLRGSHIYHDVQIQLLLAGADAEPVKRQRPTAGSESRDGRWHIQLLMVARRVAETRDGATLNSYSRVTSSQRPLINRSRTNCRPTELRGPTC